MHLRDLSFPSESFTYIKIKSKNSLFDIVNIHYSKLGTHEENIAYFFFKYK